MSDLLDSCRGLVLGAFDRTFASPETPEQPPRDKTFRLTHLRLEVRVDDDAKTVSGTAVHRLSPINDGLREITLDAADLTIRRITDDAGKVLEWETHGDALTVRLPRARKAGESFEVRIRYEAKPRIGLFFMGPDKGYPKRARIAWSQGEAMENRYWFPSYDYPNQRFTSEVIVTVADRYVALSNGRLVKETRDSRRRTRTFHWLQDKPHSNYLVALAVGEFDSKEWTADGVPVQAYVPKGKGGFIDRCFRNTPEMVAAFGKMLGFRYPWDKYAQVCVPDFTAGGMENTTLTILHEYCLTDEKAYWDYNPDDLLSHELAHMWFGDWVTTKSWGHIWLNESFATFCEYLWREHKYGADDALVAILDDRTQYFEEAETRYKRPIVTHKFVDASDMFDVHTYQKGGNVLHMLRFVLGPDLFQKAISHYLTKHGGQNVETNDLKVAIEEATGRNLDWFFDEWLYKAGHPELEVSWSWDDKAKQVLLKVKQTQEVKDPVPLFRMPVEIEIATDARAWRERVQLEKAEQVFHLDAPARPKAVMFDPDAVLLKKITFKKDKDELLWQLANAKSVAARMQAAEGLGTFLSDDRVVAALRKALTKDKFWGVRREAATALGEIRSAEAREVLLEGAKDKESRVRRGVYRALGKFREDDVAFKALAKAYMEDGWYYPMQTAALALAEARHPKAFETIVKGMDRPSQAEVVTRGACMALANLRDEKGIEVLKERTAYGRPELVRFASATALGKLGSFHEKRRDEIVEHLAALLRDTNYRARYGAVMGLEELGYTKGIAELEKTAERELIAHLRVAARLAIKAVREKHAEGAKKVEQQSELDKLKDEDKELKSRVAALESRIETIAKRRK